MAEEKPEAVETPVEPVPPAAATEPRWAIVTEFIKWLWSNVGAKTILAAAALVVLLSMQSGLVDRVLWSTGADVFIDSPQVYTRERLVNDRFREQAWLEKQLQDLKNDENIVTSYEKKIGVATVFAASLSQDVNGKALGPDVLKERLATLHGLLSESAKNMPVTSVLFPERFRKNQQYREIIRRSLIENELDDRHDLGSNSLYLFKFGAAIIPGERTRSPLKISMRLSQGSQLQPMQRVIDDIVHPCHLLYEFECGFLVGKFDGKQRIVPGSQPPTGEIYASPLVLSRQLETWDSLYFDWLNEMNRRNTAASTALFRDSESYKPQALRASRLNIRRIEENSKSVGNSVPDVFVLGKNVEMRLGNFVKDARTFREVTEAAVDDFLSRLLKPDPTIPVRVILALNRDHKDLGVSDDNPVEIVNTILKFRLGNLSGRCAMGQDVYYQVAVHSGRDTSISLQRNPAFAGVLVACILGDLDAKAAEIAPNLVARISPSHGTEFSGYPATGVLDDFLLLTPGGGASGSAVFPRTQDINFDKNGMPEPAPLSGSNPKFGSKFLKLFGQRDFGSEIDVVGGTVPIGLFAFILKMSKAQSSFSYNVSPKADFDLGSLLTADSNELTALVNSLGVGGGRSEFTARSGIRKSHRILGFASQHDDQGKSGEAQFGWIVLPKWEDGWPFGRFEMEPVNESLSALVSVPAWWGTVEIDVDQEWLEPGLLQKRHESLATIDVNLPVRLDLIENVLVNSSAQPPVVFADAIRSISVNACDPVAVLLPGQHLWRSTVVTLGTQKADLIQVMPDMAGVIAYFNHILPPRPEVLSQDTNWKTYTEPLDINVWTSEGNQIVPDKVRVTVPLEFFLGTKLSGWKC